jgi:hypothetical protein
VTDPAWQATLASELAKRLQPLVPEKIQFLPRSDGITVYEEGSGPWGGVILVGLDRDRLDLVEHALSSLQDDIVHALNAAWPPVGAPRLYLPWLKREGDLLRLGFENGIELEPLDLGATFGPEASL